MQPIQPNSKSQSGLILLEIKVNKNLSRAWSVSLKFSKDKITQNTQEFQIQTVQSWIIIAIFGKTKTYSANPSQDGFNLK